MPFIPHTEDDVRAMLQTIGVDSIERLFDEIPAELRIDELAGVPDALSEMEITRLMRARSRQDGTPLCFIGAGAYEHHVPAAVWDIATRGEFYSAYTPYQAEASQGTLQVIYEYQSMITALTALDVSNASLYDGASALAEAALMSVRANRKVKSTRILLAAGVNPTYEKVAHAISGNQGLEFERLPLDRRTGTTDISALAGYDRKAVALVIQQPSFFGTLEPIDRLTDWAKEHDALVIAVVNPTSLAVLKAPGHWGTAGADIACGEGQPLGIPLSSGGPYFGFMACEKGLVRQMPGRIVGHAEGQRLWLAIRKGGFGLGDDLAFHAAARDGALEAAVGRHHHLAADGNRRRTPGADDCGQRHAPLLADPGARGLEDVVRFGSAKGRGGLGHGSGLGL